MFEYVCVCVFFFYLFLHPLAQTFIFPFWVGVFFFRLFSSMFVDAIEETAARCSLSVCGIFEYGFLSLEDIGSVEHWKSTHMFWNLIPLNAEVTFFFIDI